MFLQLFLYLFFQGEETRGIKSQDNQIHLVECEAAEKLLHEFGSPWADDNHKMTDPTIYVNRDVQ